MSNGIILYERKGKKETRSNRKNLFYTPNRLRIVGRTSTLLRGGVGFKYDWAHSHRTG